MRATLKLTPCAWCSAGVRMMRSAPSTRSAPPTRSGGVLARAWRTSRDWRGIAAILVSWAVRGVMIALRFAGFFPGK
ncbi:hypothetical protein A2G96_31875 (plasmid) [Cupriavidus nantongensis]|uniref:Uncharacterized protein n=1 Tax=Cupriavidus nantongensis TaxID=1796606 RepID=A0A142JWL1_9BURK|nr:hypothetical protein A2G96_31875 [Cupriavidus nantongensis]